MILVSNGMDKENCIIVSNSHIHSTATIMRLMNCSFAQLRIEQSSTIIKINPPCHQGIMCKHGGLHLLITNEIYHSEDI